MVHAPPRAAAPAGRGYGLPPGPVHGAGRDELQILHARESSSTLPAKPDAVRNPQNAASSTAVEPAPCKRREGTLHAGDHTGLLDRGCARSVSWNGRKSLTASINQVCQGGTTIIMFSNNATKTDFWNIDFRWNHYVRQWFWGAS